jgi:transposase InsO family protein
VANEAERARTRAADLASARKYIAELEAKIGQQQVDLDFFRQALRRVREARRPSDGPGAPASTPPSRRVRWELFYRHGIAVNLKRVLRLMREDNLLCLRTRPFVPITTDSRHEWSVVPNLARGMVLTGLDQLWVADITYVRLLEEFAFLAVLLDAYGGGP